MKLFLQEKDRYALRATLWARVKRLPLARRDRVLLCDALELDALAKFRRENP